MIRLSSLTKRFGERVVVDGVGFEVAAGETFGFIGPNGAGKSTTMRAIMGVLEPTSGEISWKGQAVDRSIRRRFGYMPEERGLYQKMRVLPQIRYFGELYGLTPNEATRSAEALIERLDLTQYRHAEVQSLSLGNQQRAQLAVALVHGPDLLVLDEPFSGLDIVAVDALAGILHEKREEGVPIILSSHQLEVVERLIDSVAIIREGKLVATGPVAEVCRAHAPRRLRVRLSDADPGWQDHLPGQPVSASGADEVVLAPGEAVDLDEVYRAASRLGTVQSVGWVVPGLAETFRGVMA